jgi:general secretion pathway protein J
MTGPGITQRGFTLLELLVAAAIFAVMAALAYAGLDSVLRGRAVIEEHLTRLHTLQRAYVVMQRDLTQAAPRPVRDILGGTLPALRGDPQTHVLALTRAGYPNPAGVRRGHLLRVRYRLDGTRLLRLDWPVLDRAPGTKPDKAVLLKHVHKLVFQYIDTAGQAQLTWPPAGEPPTALPRAVRVTFELQGINGSVRWLFALP